MHIYSLTLTARRNTGDSAEETKNTPGPKNGLKYDGRCPEIRQI
jgi:hypothetical protein